MSMANTSKRVKDGILSSLNNEVQMKPVIITTILFVFSTTGFTDTRLETKEALLENPSVEVVRLTYPAGSESGMHTHEYPNRVAYFVKGGTLELVPQDSAKPSQVIEFADGQALFLPATTHNVRNIGDTEIVIIETEIK